MTLRSGVLTISCFVSVFLFPWPLTALLAVATAIVEPLVPLALGLFVDALYYSGGWPIATLSGAALSIVAVLVRKWLRASTIW